MVRCWVRWNARALIVAGLVGAGALAAHAEETVGEALTNGKVAVDVRYRYETVDQETFSEDAKASTIRFRLGYRTGSYHGLFAYGEFEGINAVGKEEYDDSPPSSSIFPIVADPEGSEFNQVYLGYEGLANTVFMFGRQRITLDNHRFIGNVGWRQNEQTYDAFSARYDATEKLAFFYGHLNNANTILGEDHPTASERNLNADLLNVSYDFPVGTLTGYAYLLELESTPLDSHQNIGTPISPTTRTPPPRSTQAICSRKWESRSRSSA
jgi:hypothetical protein